MRSSRNELDRLLDRLGADDEPGAPQTLTPLLHQARVARAMLAGSVPAPVAREHLATLRVDRVRNLVIEPHVRRRGLRLTAVSLVAGVALLLGANGAVAASASALPGDALYGVKRAVERVSLAMHRDAAGRAGLHLKFAATRVSEVEALVASGGVASEALDGLSASLAGAEEEASEALALGQDSGALLAHVQEMISKHIAVLTDVLAKVPDQAKGAIQQAIDNAQNAKAKAQQGHDKPSTGKPTTPPGKGGNAPGQGNDPPGPANEPPGQGKGQKSN